MSDPAVYLCYDVKGIQQFIFSVPKLKYIVGASLLIDHFDRDAANKHETGVEIIFTGGGRGTFRCDTKELAEILRDTLVVEAHGKGLDLRIGIASDISEASHHADDLYPFVPKSLDGEPCSASGLWPVPKEDSMGYADEGKGVHPIIWGRVEVVKDKNKRLLDQTVLEKLKDSGQIPSELMNHFDRLEFLTVLRMDSKENVDEVAVRAELALGGRNRFAVLAMDGNDMGMQYREFSKALSENASEEEKQKFAANSVVWLKQMSPALNECTWGAFIAGLGEAITAWWNDCSADFKNNILELGPIVLPFRPLIIGGDDILCLVHASYALGMAQTVCSRFQELSVQAAKEAKDKGINNLWPATGNQLSISAGIVYTKVTLPLYNAIPYAESLLGSAKGKYRQDRKAGEPTPAAIDWEHLTETMIDTPAARRRRDLVFEDPDMNGTPEIVLTRRPYKIENLDELNKLVNDLSTFPRSILAELLALLKLPWAKRIQRLAAMKKRQPRLVEWVADFFENDKIPCTKVVDAILLLEENHRMTQTTIGQ